MAIIPKTEEIFSLAVGLDQSGRMKNEIYCIGKYIYIFNVDRTVIVRMSIPRRELVFDTQIGFFADDYDSSEFRIEDGRIIFTRSTASKEFTRTKSCRSPSFSPEEVEKIFNSLYDPDFDGFFRMNVNREIVELLDDSLSHVEFVNNEGKIQIVQRDIFSGGTIKIDKNPPRGFAVDIANPDAISPKFRPVGVRTSDFIALFNFNPQMELRFPSEGLFFLISGPSYEMKAVMGICLYDGIGGINFITPEVTVEKVEVSVNPVYQETKMEEKPVFRRIGVDFVPGVKPIGEDKLNARVKNKQFGDKGFIQDLFDNKVRVRYDRGDTTRLTHEEFVTQFEFITEEEPENGRKEQEDRRDEQVPDRQTEPAPEQPTEPKRSSGPRPFKRKL